MEIESFVTAKEAGRFLHLNPDTVQKRARRGQLPAHPFGDGSRRCWRFLLSELDSWLRAQVQSPCADTRPQ